MGKEKKAKDKLPKHRSPQKELGGECEMAAKHRENLERGQSV